MKLRRNHIPFLSSILHNLNQDIAKFGVQEAFHKVIHHKIRVEVNGLDAKLAKILQSERVILVSNHPHEIEPFVLLASLPSRNDVFVITNAMFLNWMSNLNKYLIPVFVKHRLGNIERLKFRARLFWLLPLANRFMSYQEAHQINIESIRRASQKIDKGGMIIIFPGIELPRWFNGVGFMLKQTETDLPIYMIKVSFSGTTKFDLLRLIPGTSMVFPKVILSFSKAIKIINLRKLSGKDITTKLEADYKKWMLIRTKN